MTNDRTELPDDAPPEHGADAVQDFPLRDARFLLDPPIGVRNMVLGCLADDFTGAGDAASFLAAGGMRTLLLSGIPKETESAAMVAGEADAVVIALKTRTQETAAAVRDFCICSSMAAITSSVSGR